MEQMILVIEDNIDFRENVAELLSLEGFKVITADCGMKGLTIAKELLPDLIICDILMNGMNGYEVYAALNQNNRTRNIPFIFSTAMSENSEKNHAKELGVKNYLIKPFDEFELMRCVRRSLRVRSTRRKQLLSVSYAGSISHSANL